MEPLNLLSYINTTYGVAVALKSNLSIIKLERKEQTGLTALVDTLEQNLYNIKIEVEELINLH